MEQYINKAAVVAEVNSLQETTMDKNQNFLSSYHEGIFDGLSLIKSFLDTIEGKGVIAGQECICNGVFNKIIGSSWNLTIPLDKVGLKHGDKVEVLIIKR